MLGRQNCIKRLPPIVFIAEAFDVFAGQTGDAGNSTNALQSSLDLHHWINTILSSAFGGKSLGAEDEAGNQMTRNNRIGANAGALERACINELPNCSVEFEFPWWLARGAAATPPWEGLASKHALDGCPAGFCRPLR